MQVLNNFSFKKKKNFMVAAKFEGKLTFDSNSSGQLSGGFVYPLSSCGHAVLSYDVSRVCSAKFICSKLFNGLGWRASWVGSIILKLMR